MPDPKSLRVHPDRCPDSRCPRRLHRFDQWLLGIGAVLALLAPAVAAAIPGPVPASGFVPVQVLCDGDCSGLPTPAAFPGGGPLDYELAIRVPRVTGAPLDLSIVSQRNVVLLGPVQATGSIVLQGDQGVHIGSGAVITASEGAGVTVETGGTVVIDGPENPPIIAGPRPIGPPGSGPICACLSIGSGGEVSLRSRDVSLQRVSGPTVSVIEGDLRALQPIRLRGSLALAAAVAGTSPADPMGLRYSESRSGDIYVEFSGGVLRSIDVVAGGVLYIDGPASVPTPEPGTALLVALGLATLAGRRGAR